jgi:hypothetical protein
MTESAAASPAAPTMDIIKKENGIGSFCDRSRPARMHHRIGGFK